MNTIRLIIISWCLTFISSVSFSQSSPGEAELIKAEEAMSNGKFQEWFTAANKSCDLGNMFACYMVAKGYDPQMAQSLPYPGTKDMAKAFIYYKKSGDLGLDMASFMTADLYRLGEGIAQNNDKAIEYFKKAYWQGSADASNAIYQMLKSPAAFIAFLEESVGKGYFQAARELGTIYINGDMGEVNINKSMKWLKVGEANNHAGSMYVLGYLYRNGLKETSGSFELDKKSVNISKAVDYYTRAANLGNTESMNNLAEMNMQGVELSRNMNTAFDWFKKSCSFNSGYACYMCSAMLSQGYISRAGEDAAAYARKSIELGYDPTRKK